MARDRQRAKQRRARREKQGGLPAPNQPERENVPEGFEHGSAGIDIFEAKLVSEAERRDRARGLRRRRRRGRPRGPERRGVRRRSRTTSKRSRRRSSPATRTRSPRPRRRSTRTSSPAAPSAPSLHPTHRRRRAASASSHSCAPPGRSCSASSGRTAVRSVRPPPSSWASSWSQACTSASPTPPPNGSWIGSSSPHVSLVRRQHQVRAREEGQAEPRAPHRLARPGARRALGRRARPRPSPSSRTGRRSASRSGPCRATCS